MNRLIENGYKVKISEPDAIQKLSYEDLKKIEKIISKINYLKNIKKYMYKILIAPTSLLTNKSI